MPSPSYLSLSMRKGFYTSSSWSEVHAFGSSLHVLFLQQGSYISPIVLAKPVSAPSLCLPSKVTAWISASQLPDWYILPAPCSDVYQTPHSCLVFNNPVQSASLSVSLPSSLHPWPQHVNSPLRPRGYLSSFLPTQVPPYSLLRCWFSLQPQFPSLLPLLAPFPCLSPVHHPAASHSFPCSRPQLPGQTTRLHRPDVKDIFEGIKQHILPLTFLSEMALSLGCYLSKFSRSSRHQLWKSEAKTVKASQSYEQLNTRSHTGTCCAALTTYNATGLSWNLIHRCI